MKVHLNKELNTQMVQKHADINRTTQNMQIFAVNTSAVWHRHTPDMPAPVTETR